MSVWYRTNQLQHTVEGATDFIAAHDWRRRTVAGRNLRVSLKRAYTYSRVEIGASLRQLPYTGPSEPDFS